MNKGKVKASSLRLPVPEAGLDIVESKLQPNITQVGYHQKQGRRAHNIKGYFMRTWPSRSLLGRARADVDSRNRQRTRKKSQQLLTSDTLTSSSAPPGRPMKHEIYLVLLWSIPV